MFCSASTVNAGDPQLLCPRRDAATQRRTGPHERHTARLGMDFNKQSILCEMLDLRPVPLEQTDLTGL